MNLPTDVANQALDAIGSEIVLGDIEDGTREASVLLRAYRNCLMQLLRAANWDFARRTAPLSLLADATGQTPNVGTIVPVPWTYEYQYPIDCAKLRFVPYNQPGTQSPIPPGNIQISTAPQTTGTQQPPLFGQRLIPAPFVISQDNNYPPPAGTINWEVQGVSPQGRTVILTNVQNAHAVYTSIVLYPSVWDPLFRNAMVAYLASEVTLALTKDKRLGLTLRAQQIQIAKEKLREARAVDGNEGWYSSDIRVDWMAARNTGGAWWNSTLGPGFGPGTGGGWWGGGFNSLSFSDGSAY
jgi:hypothetical protein